MGGGGIHAADDVGDPDADLHRLAFRLAGQAHDAAKALGHQIIPGAMRVGAGLPEAGDRTIDQPRLDCPHGRVIQPIFRQSPNFEILHQDVAFFRQFADRCSTLWVSDIHRDRTFVAIGRQVISAFVSVQTVRAQHVRRAPAAGFIAQTWLFDLDHIGTVIAQKLGASRPGKNARQIKNP